MGVAPGNAMPHFIWGTHACEHEKMIQTPNDFNNKEVFVGMAGLVGLVGVAPPTGRLRGRANVPK